MRLLKAAKVIQQAQVQVKPEFPAKCQTPPSSQGRSIRERIRACFTRVWRLSLLFQVSHRGKYSIERMRALDEYTRSKSLLRVATVCFATPLPMIITVFIQESIPLAPPAADWRSNYGFWTRVAVLGGAVSASILMELQLRIEGIRITGCAFLLVVCISSAMFACLGICLAAVWMFPVPYINVFIGSLGLPLMTGLVRVICGQQTWNTIVRRHKLVGRVFLLLSAEVMTAGVYAAYTIVFRAANHTMFQLPLLLALPVIKLVMKNIVASCADHLEELIPESVMFSVESFNALYIAMCLQITPSPRTMTIILVLDSVYLIVALYGLYRCASHLLHNGGDIPTQSTFLGAAHAAYSMVLSKSPSPTNLILRVRSCTRQEMSPSHTFLLHQSKTHSAQDVQRQVVPTSTRSITLSQQEAQQNPSRNAVDLASSSAVREPNNTQEVNSESSTNIMDEALGTLFTSECLIIAEYLEVVIPMVYGVYVLGITHLPVAHYHGELEGISSQNIRIKVGMVFWYSFLEFLSLVLLVLVMQRKCRLHAVHHLAFVLERHAGVIQAKLIVWMVALSGMQIPHFGMAKMFKS